MKIALLQLIILCWVFSLFAGPADEISKAVVYLRHDVIETVEKDGEKMEVWLKHPGSNDFRPKIDSISGTGLLVFSETTNLYLVTAKHVAKALTLTPSDLLVSSFIGPKELGIPSGTTVGIPLPILSGTNLWLHHESQDVSVLRLNGEDSRLKIALFQHFAPLEMLRRGTNAPSRDIELRMFGFPLGEGIGGTDSAFSPITRTTRAASGPLAGGSFFLLQDSSVQGYSGGPVFDVGGQGARTVGQGMGFGVFPTVCYGFISATLADDTGGKMAQVISSKCVLELISKMESVK